MGDCLVSWLVSGPSSQAQSGSTVQRPGLQQSCLTGPRAGVEVARKVGKHVPLLRRLWGGARRRFPHLTDGILKFAEIWDAFTESTLDFEDR